MPHSRFFSRPANGLRPLTAADPANQAGPAGSAGADESWQARGLCRMQDPEEWFTPTRMAKAQVDRVKKICDACPVKTECLNFALTTDERFGIWGATTPGERKAMKGPAQPKPPTPSAKQRADAILAAGRKECPRCRTTKLLDQFPLDRSALTGFSSACKVCRSDMQRGRRRCRQAARAPHPGAVHRAEARVDVA